MWQIVANLEFVTRFAIDLQTRKPNISPRAWLNNDYVSSHLTNVIKTSITIVSINNNNIFKHPGHSVL